MQDQDVVRHQTNEAPIVIRSTGLSMEAKEMFDTIAKRAYEIFEAKGRAKGRDLDHWLQAEAELFEPATLHVKESPEGVTVLADVRGFAPKDLEIDLEPKRVTIIGKHRRPTEKRSTRILRACNCPLRSTRITPGRGSKREFSSWT